MNKLKGMTFNITHIQGATREFERTGTYPEYLRFHKAGTRQNWLIRIKQTPQQGVLKSNGKLVYEYCFEEDLCKYREILDDGTFTEWLDPEFMIKEMRN